MEIRKIKSFSKIYEVDVFQKEFLQAVGEHPANREPFPRYQKWLIAKLRVLEERGASAISLRDFECVTKGKEPKIYSIRYPRSQKNPRVLYVFIEGDLILLLGAFLEKDRSDYSKNIEKAEKRLKILMTE